jgi:hypothetical protein
MATYTKNIKLLKPAETEKYDVNLRNDNWDKIDKAIGDTSDLIKKHKEANPIDHPDGSVTTPKLRDKCVTPEKLSEELNLKLKSDFVKRIGDTMTGNLEFNNSIGVVFNNANNTIKTKIRVASNGNLDIGLVESNTEYKAINDIKLNSVNKPCWYNNKIGNKPLATEEDVLNETKKCLKLAGGTMNGDINFVRGQSGIKFDGGNNKIHAIGVGGNDGENLDVGSTHNTDRVALCSKNVPGWYNGSNFFPFALQGDFTITSGTIDHDQYLPVPQGFSENECTWLVSLASGNKDDNRLNMYNLHTLIYNPVCYREGRRVKVGIYIKTHSSDTGGPRYETFYPGTANYMCIAVRRRG